MTSGMTWAPNGRTFLWPCGELRQHQLRNEGMPHIQAKPRHLLSWCFELFADRAFPTTLELSWVRERGGFLWDGLSYRMGREAWLSGDFFLMNGDVAVAKADKSSAFFRRFVVSAGDREMILAAESPFTRCFRLTENGRTIGSIRPNHPFTRKCTIDLPDDLEMPVRVFIFWLVVLMWRRAANSNSQ